MAFPEKSDVSLADYVDAVTANLKYELEQYRRVMKTFVKEVGGREETISYCLLVDCPARRAFRQVLSDTLKVLKDTRSDQGSKELETLREDLEQALQRFK